jgi:hypothetical protein
LGIKILRLLRNVAVLLILLMALLILLPGAGSARDWKPTFVRVQKGSYLLLCDPVTGGCSGDVQSPAGSTVS